MMIEYTVKVDEYGNRFWCLNGKLHREDGPAVEYVEGTKKWFLDGVCYTENHFNELTKPRELTVNQIEELLGYKIKVVGND